jgi:hypothetical protein
MEIKKLTNIKNSNSNNQIRLRSIINLLKIKSTIKQIITKTNIESMLG